MSDGQPMTIGQVNLLLERFTKRIIKGTVIFAVSLILLVVLLAGLKEARAYARKHEARHGEVERILKKHNSDMQIIIKGINANSKVIDEQQKVIKTLVEHQRHGRNPKVSTIQ